MPKRTTTLFSLILLSACQKSAPTPHDPQIRVSTQGRFVRDGRELRILGVNVYSLASSPDRKKYGCGIRYDDEGLDMLFKEIVEMVQPPYVPAVRFWAYQSFTDSGKDFSRIDAVLAAAKKHNVLLVPVLEDQWHHCSRGGYRFADWYLKGYRKPYAGYKRSLRDYARIFAERYRDAPEILMIQIMNEAETRRLGGQSEPLALQGFALDMSTLIRSVDPDRIVSLGTFGDGRSSTEGAYYPLLHAPPSIGVVEAHDYKPETVSDPVRNCVETARQLKKPCVIGEMGLPAIDAEAKAKRAPELVGKVRAAFNAGASAVFLWSYRAGDGHNMEFDRQDPLYDAIRTTLVPTAPTPQ